MPLHEELSPGEIARTLRRIETGMENLARQMQVALGPVTALGVRQDRLETDVNRLGEKIDALEEKVETVQTKAAFISGFIAAVMGGLEWVVKGR